MVKLLCRPKNDGLLAVIARTAQPVAGVEERDIDHEANEQNHKPGLDTVQNSRTHRTAADGFDEREGDMPAVEHRQREQIDQREIHIEDDAEPQYAPPAVLA